MAEPTSTTGAIALGIASGTVGAMLVALGISLPAVIWGICGCVVGLSWAPSVGRLRAFALFCAACLLSAKAGMVTSATWYAGSSDVSGMAAAACGIVFHPALTAVVNALPAYISKRLA